MADHIGVMLVPRRISAVFSSLCAGVALLAAQVPAMRASRVDALEALRAR